MKINFNDLYEIKSGASQKKFIGSKTKMKKK